MGGKNGKSISAVFGDKINMFGTRFFATRQFITRYWRRLEVRRALGGIISVIAPRRISITAASVPGRSSAAIMRLTGIPAAVQSGANIVTIFGSKI